VALIACCSGFSEVFVIHRPPGIGAFQFVILAKLRAAQLMRGCRPRVDVDGTHKAIVIAQLEVAEGKVTQVAAVPVGTGALTVGATIVDMETIAM
jgi:hypothetical protein